MNLETVFQLVPGPLAEAGVECLLIGGFAVNYHGYTRNTLDVDFMIVADRLEIVRRVMTAAGFTNVAIEGPAAFFNAPETPVRVDFLNVDADTMRRLMAHAIPARVYGFDVFIPALKDLLAMKIHSLSSDPARRSGKDLTDIAYLSVLNHLDMQADIEPLCSKYGTPGISDKIRVQIDALRTP
jgi:hypothetical protein